MQPMLATAAQPPDRLPDGPGWVHEVKWDGVRVLAGTGGPGGRWRLTGRQGSDVTAGYPELGTLAALDGTVLDGEVVALRDGAPSFAALAERMHLREPERVAAAARRVPVTYLVFDVLVHRGEDVTGRSWEHRRGLLDGLGLDDGSHPAAAVPPVHDDGPALWRATAEQHLEGVVAKRRSAAYQPGRRSPDWVKAVHRSTRTALVCGWRPESTGAGRLGAVLLAAPDQDGSLRYLGRAGSGLTGPVGRLLTGLLGSHGRETPAVADVPAADARGAVWVEPVVVVDLRYLGRTPAGRLRQPVLRGVRDDTGPDPWAQW